MSDILKLRKLNEVFLQVGSDRGILKELSEYFTFEVPGHKFMPSYRNKSWDGKIRLFSYQDQTIYSGLLPRMVAWAVKRNYNLENLNAFKPSFPNSDDIKSFLSSLDVCSNNKKIEFRDYQSNAVLHTLNNKRCILLSPTASGKSLIIYALSRYLKDKKVLIIVPTTSLVEQMYKDFVEYSTYNGWDAKKNCHILYSGKEKDTDKPILISTWQSLFRMDKSFFKDFDMVIGDEAHLHKASSLKKILENCTNCEYRIGTTGTLDGSKVHQFVLEGLFGSVYKVTTTKKLIDNKTLSDLKIHCIVLKYSDEEKELVSHLEYRDELNFLILSEKRNQFIVDMVKDLKGNTLLLFQMVEKHGEALFEMIKQQTKKDVSFIHGKISADDREDIRLATEKKNNSIIVASYGTYSTGINIRNLHNVVFASPSKSRIRNLQSIGRALRRTDNKISANLFDISDDLTLGKKMNYTYRHFLERLRIYDSEKFTYSIFDFDI